MESRVGVECETDQPFGSWSEQHGARPWNSSLLWFYPIASSISSNWLRRLQIHCIYVTPIRVFFSDSLCPPISAFLSLWNLCPPWIRAGPMHPDSQRISLVLHFKQSRPAFVRPEDIGKKKKHETGFVRRRLRQIPFVSNWHFLALVVLF